MIGNSDPMRRDLGTSGVNFGAPVVASITSRGQLDGRRRAVWSGPDGAVRTKHPSHGEGGVGPTDQQRGALLLVLVHVHCLGVRFDEASAEHGKRIKCSDERSFVGVVQWESGRIRSN